MKKQIKTSEKELSNNEIDNLSEAEFKTLAIRMLTELTEFAYRMKEEMKSTQNEIKQNIQQINSEGKEIGAQISGLEQKEEINIQPEQNEETRIQRNEEKLQNLWDNIKHSNIRIIGVLEGEEEEQEIENLLEEITKENFPNLVKEIDLQEVQEAQRVPKKLDPRRKTSRHIIIKLPKIKDKERILKGEEKRRELPTKEFP